MSDLLSEVAVRPGDRVLRIVTGACANASPSRRRPSTAPCRSTRSRPCRTVDELLSELRRVVRPGGRLAVAVWGPVEENPAFSALADSLHRRGGVRAVAAVHWLSSLSRPDDLRALLSEAGFDQLHVRRRTAVAEYPLDGLAPRLVPRHVPARRRDPEASHRRTGRHHRGPRPSARNRVPRRGSCSRRSSMPRSPHSRPQPDVRRPSSGTSLRLPFTSPSTVVRLTDAPPSRGEERSRKLFICDRGGFPMSRFHRRAVPALALLVTVVLSASSFNCRLASVVGPSTLTPLRSSRFRRCSDHLHLHRAPTRGRRQRVRDDRHPRWPRRLQVGNKVIVYMNQELGQTQGHRRHGGGRVRFALVLESGTLRVKQGPTASTQASSTGIIRTASTRAPDAIG